LAGERDAGQSSAAMAHRFSGQQQARLHRFDLFEIQPQVAAAHRALGVLVDGAIGELDARKVGDEAAHWARHRTIAARPKWLIHWLRSPPPGAWRIARSAGPRSMPLRSRASSTTTSSST